jgi:hypothetical protein
VSWINEIRNFLEDYSGVYPESQNTDIFKDLGVVGDDFHEMIDKYSNKYQVDMTDYLWYFHADEEGHNFGGLFVKAPYEKVKRIPVTPKMLTDFIETKKWVINYPIHNTLTSRPDLLINKIILIGFFVVVIIWLIIKLFK